ncbi:DUF4192 domain-containing protein [Propionibacteriaceae bacterium Y2011]
MTVHEPRRDHTADQSDPDQTRVRVSSTADMLALIPYLLGFQPHDSLVVVLLGGNRVQLTARVDLPRPEGRRDVFAIADHFRGVAQHSGADGAVLAVFSADEPWAVEVVTEVEAELGELVFTSLVCTGDSFRVVVAGEAGPSTAFDPAGTATAATAVYHGMRLLPDRESLAALTAPGDPAAIRAVADAADTVRLPWLLADRRLEMVCHVETLLRRDEPPGPDDCARLALLAIDLEVRDVAWFLMRPDNAKDHLKLWGEVARRSPMDLSAAPVCLFGMAAWLSGDGATALCCAERAMDEHPGYTMAQLVFDLVESATPPQAWADMVATEPPGLTDLAG